jgi:hypothetical protein
MNKYYKLFSWSGLKDPLKCLFLCEFTRDKDLYSTNMSYYNVCGIGSQQSNISKGKGGVHIAITGMQDSNQGRKK